MRIFTHSSISPGLSLRQCSTRYAFRAGRNLPDKEFRYLRTVIVTAAVHRGFSSERKPFPLTFRHWAGVSPYTSAYALAQTCVFVKQSVEPFLCDPRQLDLYKLHRQGRSFSQSYGSILPSSLTRVSPIALVCSTRLPVSVCGTDARLHRLEAFLDSGGSTTSGQRPAYNRSSSLRGFTYEAQRSTGSAPGLPSPGWSTLLRPPIAPSGGTGILTCCPSPTLLSLGLGPTNPTRINLPSETLDIRRTWFSHVLRYSCRHSLLCRPQAVLPVSPVFLSPAQRSPTTLPKG